MTVRPPLRVAIAGAGMISRHHLMAWRAFAPEVDIVAICDPVLERAAARAAEFGIGFACTSADALFAGSAFDALDVASPRETHADWVLAAARRGIAILCQKPLTPTLAEAEALLRAIGPATRLMVHENWRFRPWYRQARRWLEEGAAGDILLARMTLLSSFMLPGPTGRSPAFDRQPFMARERRLMIAEVLIHQLDVMRFLCGPLRVVAARTLRTRPEIAGETVADILLEMAGGRPVSVVGTMTAPGLPSRAGDRLEIVGSTASIVFDDWTLCLHGPDRREIRFDPAAGYQESFDAAIGHFVTALRSATPFETDAVDNLETLRLVEHAYWAAGQHAPLPAFGEAP